MCAHKCNVTPGLFSWRATYLFERMSSTKQKGREEKEREKSVSHLVGDLFNVFSVSGNSLV